MSFDKEMATASQYAQFGLLVAQQVVAKMEQKDLSKKEMQKLLTPPCNGKVKEIVTSIFDQIIFDEEPISNFWNREIEKLNLFWGQNFGREIPWSELKFPERKQGFGFLEYIPDDITEDEIASKYLELFGSSSLECEYYGDEKQQISESIKEQQFRPKGNRLISHRGGQCDQKTSIYKSYEDFCIDGRNYMIPIEGLIAALRYRTETGKLMQTPDGGVTRFHAIDHNDHAIIMYYNSNKLEIGGTGIDASDWGDTPREVCF